MINTSQNRLISMTYWYPMLAELQYYTAHPITDEVKIVDGKLTRVPVEPSTLRVRVPDTVFVHYPYSRELGHITDGEIPRGWDDLTLAIDNAAGQFRYPVFLRTEFSSDKHSWKDTCYLENRHQIEKHVGNLVEHSLMHDLPCDFFAVRRLIPTEPIATAFYGDMPIAKECRVFIRDGAVACTHPYWPDEAFEGQNIKGGDVKMLQQFTDEETTEITRIAEYIAHYFPSWWSIDFLKDKDDNWWCIDMALGASSYHWADCPQNTK